jgi:hypothetical protein
MTRSVFIVPPWFETTAAKEWDKGRRKRLNRSTDMTIAATFRASFRTPGAAFGSRLARLPLVLLLTVGMLLSLIHCAGDALNIASAPATLALSQDQGSLPDPHQQQLPCHSGHCLSHLTAQPAPTVALPSDAVPPARIFRQERFPATLAGLPLFKPPRA